MNSFKFSDNSGFFNSYAMNRIDWVKLRCRN